MKRLMDFSKCEKGHFSKLFFKHSKKTFQISGLFFRLLKQSKKSIEITIEINFVGKNKLWV